MSIKAVTFSRGQSVKRGRPKFWTAARLSTLEALAIDGLSGKNAAKTMGVTYDAVRTAASHYGIRFGRKTAC